MSDDLANRAERALDLALARLATVDLEPLTSRVLYRSAERRLLDRSPKVSQIERAEPAILVATASLHLLWAVTRVLAAL